MPEEGSGLVIRADGVEPQYLACSPFQAVGTCRHLGEGAQPGRLHPSTFSSTMSAAHRAGSELMLLSPQAALWGTF